MFRFNLSVSDQAFEEKPQTNSEYSKITFTQQNVSLSEFVDIVKDGHMFCAVMDDYHFPNKDYKTSQHYIHSNVVSIDIDDCDCSMRDFMSTLKYSPSIAYETFSNLEEGKGYRFRLLYVFKDTLDSMQYKSLYNAICKANDIDGSYNDKHAGSPYQKIWGTSKKRSVIPVGMLYSIESFSQYIESVQSTILKEKKKRVVSGVDWTPDTNIKFTDTTFEDYWNRCTDIDILYHMRHYQTFETTQIDWEDGELWRDLEDTHYYEIKRKWTMRLTFNGGRYKRIPVNRLLKNGEHRRNKIFTSLMRRRLIDPTITLEHLCYAALFELHYFIDNTDNSDYITRQQLQKTAQNAYTTDLECYREKLRENKKFKINKMEAERQGLTVQQAVGKANAARRMEKKEKVYQEMMEKYDKNKSVRQNAEILGVSRGTVQALKKWLREHKNTQVDNLSTQEQTTQQEALKYPILEEEDNSQLVSDINNKLDKIIYKLERIENISNIYYNIEENMSPVEKWQRFNNNILSNL